jgi:hypothetical protein
MGGAMTRTARAEPTPSAVECRRDRAGRKRATEVEHEKLHAAGHAEHARRHPEEREAIEEHMQRLSLLKCGCQQPPHTHPAA